MTHPAVSDGVVSGPASTSPQSVAASRAQQIAARIERLPTSRWHAKARLTVGIATFFDAFDALVIAQVLPILVHLWRLGLTEVGLLISTGYAGQLLGSLFFGWLAGRIGRVRAICTAIVLFASMSLCCGMAHDYQQLLIFRSIQGFGLGGQVPIAAVYISEITRAHGRGKFVLLYEFIFTLGVFACGLVGSFLMPLFGWRFMFILGAVPILIAFILPRLLPESPRWLASRGQFAEAETALSSIERHVERTTGRLLPKPIEGLAVEDKKATWSDYFGPRYLTRTIVIWTLWFSSYLVYYGVGTWLPTLYRTVFNLPVETSLRYALVTNFCGVLAALLAIFTVDKIGRKRMSMAMMAGCGGTLCLLYFCGADKLGNVIFLASLSYFFATAAALIVYVYTPELYPTRARAQGFGMACACLRLSAIVGPIFVGMTVKSGIDLVFLAFGVVAIAGALTVALLGTETSGRSLEELSP